MAVAVNGNPLGRYTVVLVDAADTASYVAAVSHFGLYSSQVVLLTNGSTMPAGDKAFLNGVDTAQTTVYPVGPAAPAAMASSWSGSRRCR